MIPKCLICGVVGDLRDPSPDLEPGSSQVRIIQPEDKATDVHV